MASFHVQARCNLGPKVSWSRLSRADEVNPLNRYLINSPMLPDLKRDADGGLTIYLQHESPGKEKEANCLPVPDGEFVLIMRLYWPKEEALTGESQPPLCLTSTRGR